MDPGTSAVTHFFIDGQGYLRFLKPRPPENTAHGVHEAVTSGELRNNSVLIDSETGQARVLSRAVA